MSTIWDIAEENLSRFETDPAPGHHPPPSPIYTREDMLRLWPNTARQLWAYAEYLALESDVVTACQIRIALALAEAAYHQLTEDFPP